MAIQFSKLNIGDIAKTIGNVCFKKYTTAQEPVGTPELVYRLSSDGTYYIVGTGFTSVEYIQVDESGGTNGSGINSAWSGGDLVIPSKYNGKPVKAIASRAFANNTKIVNIYIADGITHIGHSSIMNAVRETKMKSVRLPSTLIYIGRKPFNYRAGLEEIEIPHIKSVDAYTIAYMDNLKKVTQNAEILKEYSHYNCPSVEEMSLYNTKEIKSSAFGYNFFKSQQAVLKIFSTEPPILNQNGFSGNNPLARIEVPLASLEAYQTATNWSQFASKMVGV